MSVFRLQNFERTFAVLVFAVVMGLSAAGLSAQDDSEEAKAVGFDWYGQINRGILWYDDGESSEIYPFVDNSKSVSRLGLTYDRPLENEWHFQALSEIGLNWKETNHINQLDPNDDGYDFSEQGIRKFEVSFAHPRYGTFYIGQGAMASDGITGQDLSLTTVVAGTAVKDMAGGLLLVPEEGDGTPSNVRILDRFPTLGSSRRLRLRYDNRINDEWSYSAAAGREVLVKSDGRYYVDAAVRYDATKGDFRTKAGAAIQWVGGYPDTKFRDEDVSLAISGSVLHRPSRYNISGTVGYRVDDGGYIYGKLGRRYYKIFPVGWTAFSIDHYFGRDIGNVDNVSNSTGIAAVQQFREINSHLYLALRTYDVSDEGVDYRRSYAVLTGFRWQF